MANERQVMDGLVQLLNVATTGVTVAPFGTITTTWGVGLAPENAVLANPQVANTCLGSVYDRKMSVNSTRWPRTLYTDGVITPGIAAAANKNYTLPASGTIAVTFTGSRIAGDVASIQLTDRVTHQAYGISYNTIGGDTPTSIATALAAAINAATGVGPPAGIGTVATAVGAGAVLTVTNLLTHPLTINCVTVNSGFRTIEVHRQKRMCGIYMWYPSEPVRIGVGDAVSNFLANAESLYGYQIPSGTAAGEWVRLIWDGSQYDEKYQNLDNYVRVYHVVLEYSTKYTDTVYPVATPVFTDSLTRIPQ